MKPEFWQDKELAELSEGTQLMFIGLMGLADRNGLLEDVPEVITGLLRPFNLNNPTDKQLSELHSEQFIVRYETDGKRYIWLPNLEKHQPIHPKEASYGIPLPDSVIASLREIPSNYRELNEENGTRVHTKGKGNSKGNSNSKGKEEEIPFAEILSHLNTLTGKDYKHTGRATQGHIRARWNEGWRLDDFQYVNLVKAAEWLGGDMEKFLRPETLYGNKFEGYRNQRPKSEFSQMSERQKQSALACMEWLKKGGDNGTIAETDVRTRVE